MLVVSLLQLILPFLTQALVDVGISDGNLDVYKRQGLGLPNGDV